MLGAVSSLRPALVLALTSLALACGSSSGPPASASTGAKTKTKAKTGDEAPAGATADEPFAVDPEFAKLVPKPEPKPPSPEDALRPPRPSGWLEAGLPEVEGPRKLKEVRARVAERSHELLGCYEAGLPKFPELHGELVFRFVIEPEGQVDEYEALGVEVFAGERVAACMLRGISRWKWQPIPAGRTHVDYPFRFGTE